jgi:hypothetical protein
MQVCPGGSVVPVKLIGCPSCPPGRIKFSIAAYSVPELYTEGVLPVVTVPMFTVGTVAVPAGAPLNIVLTSEILVILAALVITIATGTSEYVKAVVLTDGVQELAVLRYT